MKNHKIESRLQKGDLRRFLMARALCSSLIDVAKHMDNELDAREFIVKLRGQRVGCHKCGRKKAELKSGYYGQCKSTKCGHRAPWHYDTVLPLPTTASGFLFCLYLQQSNPTRHHALVALREHRKRPGSKPTPRWRITKKLKGYRNMIELAEQTHTLADLPIEQGGAGLSFGKITF